MNDDPRSTLLSDTFLAQVRQLEPDADPEKVRVLVDELREAAREMDKISLEGVPLPVGFSPRWSEGAAP